jgi:hypothetical protein
MVCFRVLETGCLRYEHVEVVVDSGRDLGLGPVDSAAGRGCRTPGAICRQGREDPGLEPEDDRVSVVGRGILVAACLLLDIWRVSRQHVGVDRVPPVLAVR